MDLEYGAAGSDTRRRRPWLRALVLLAVGFVVGLLAMGYALTHWDSAARFIKTGSPAPLQDPAPFVTAPPPRALAVIPPARASDQATLDRRVAGLEQRLSRIDARADAAVGNADRADGLLVAFAARRALDRGVALGFIEGLLRDRFGDDQPQAVATIISAARQPVTLDRLQSELELAAPSLVAHAPDEPWWQGFRRELADLIVLRHVGTPSPAPEDRLARARNQLQAGHVDAALAEVARLPGRASAGAWIALARRYAAARSALDMIETTALLSSHGPARPAPAADAPASVAAPAEAAAGPADL